MKQNKKIQEALYFRKRIVKNPASHLNIDHWNRVINSCDNYMAAKQWVDYIKSSGIVKPNLYTFNKLLKRTDTLAHAFEILDEMNKQGIKEDTWTMNIIMQHWAKTFDVAVDLLKKMTTEPNLVTFDILVRMATTTEQVQYVMTIMDYYKRPYDIQVWNQLIKVANNISNVQIAYNMMCNYGETPNKKTDEIFNNVLQCFTV